jgi:hypothetical protein
MKYYPKILIAIFLFLPFSAHAQFRLQDALLISPIYSETLEPLPTEPEKWLASYLRNYTLQSMVDEGIIHRDDMMGFALPLGVHNRQTPVDGYVGLLDMWQAKAKFVANKSENIWVEVMQKSLELLLKARLNSTKITLKDYRNTVLSPAIDSVKNIHLAHRDLFSEPRRIFMDRVVAHLSPNILLGYNIQELIPPTQMVEGVIYDVNPLFKAFYLERMLQELGLEFIEAFPARYDALLSHGPFQMTNLAIRDGLLANPRLFDEMKVYRSMSELKSIQDHVNVAAFFAYYNWEMLSFSLQANGLLDQFNSYFRQVETDENKAKELQVLLAGLTAAMHHNPAEARQMLATALRNGAKEKLYFATMQNGDKQMRKYFRSAAEAYLILKVYDLLIYQE